MSRGQMTIDEHARTFKQATDKLSIAQKKILLSIIKDGFILSQQSSAPDQEKLSSASQTSLNTT